MKTFLLSVFISLLSASAMAQLTMPDMGNNPSDIRWKYYDTKGLKIIFPEGNDSQATRVANIINYIYSTSDSVAVTVGDKRKHLQLLVQTNQVISNGYVALAPYRSEFYATSFQNFNELGSIDWLDALSVHEYRHALQFANSRRGLTKFGYVIGGENLWFLMANVSLPNWYLEGDAVQTETLLSPAGRGRTPYFFKEQKALLFNNKNYSYAKARNGSFKSMMPDHYRLGYVMLHHVRNEYNPYVWRDVLADAGAYKGLFYPFSRALKRHTGLTTPKMYKKAYAAMKEQWEKELQGIQLIATTQVTAQPKRTVTSYEWPHQLSDGSIVAFKTSYKQIPHLVHIKNGKEEKLVTLGVLTEAYLSVNGGKAVWVEHTTDPRWQNRNYNDIVSYDLATHKRKKITHKTKLFSPQFSNSGDRIVAVKADEHIKTSLVFIDPSSGNETIAYANSEGYFLSYPRWTKDDKALVFLAKKNSQIAILKYDLSSQTTTELTPWSHHVIAATNVATNNVYFTASYSGINNVYAAPLNGSKELKQISSVKISAEMPFVTADETTLLMSEFDVMGYKLTSQPVNSASAKTVSITEPVDMDVFHIKTTASENNVLNRFTKTTYEQHAYTGLVRDPKLHTWGLNSELNGIGLSLKINNILNDFAAGFAFGYNRNENTLSGSASIDYAKFYLPISLGAIVNERSTLVYNDPTLTISDSLKRKTLSFQEAILRAGLSLPLAWIHGPNYTSLKLSAGVEQIMTSDYKIKDSSLTIPSYNFTTIAGGLTFSNIRQQALQQALPRFGQELSVLYNKSISSSDALRIMVNAALYFPGFMRTHILYFKGGWMQQKQNNNYRYLDIFNHARGYRPILGDEEYVASVNYMLPLFYPDRGFAGLAYLKRIRLNAFADISEVKRDAINKTISQNSAGAELLFDVRIIHLIPLSFALRYSSLLDNDYYNSKLKENLEVTLYGTF